MSKSTRSRFVTLRHATPRKNVRSIHEHGLLPWLAKGRLRAVWLHSPAQTDWAIAHVARRHAVDPADVVILEVEVSRRVLKRFKRGLWTCPVRIAPQFIVSTNGLKLVG